MMLQCQVLIYFLGIERTKRIIQGLEQENAIAGIFVLGTHLLDDTGKKKELHYDQAGHIIGNHTYSCVKNFS